VSEKDKQIFFPSFLGCILILCDLVTRVCGFLFFFVCAPRVRGIYRTRTMTMDLDSTRLERYLYMHGNTHPSRSRSLPRSLPSVGWVHVEPPNNQQPTTQHITVLYIVHALMADRVAYSSRSIQTGGQSDDDDDSFDDCNLPHSFTHRDPLFPFALFTTIAVLA
jgi:hypothetical protein